MIMGKNVLIPLPLLNRIIELLGYWNTSSYDRVICDEYCDIVRELEVKALKLDLREAYSKIIKANTEDARHSARMEYLRQKNYIRDV
jgi:hypothetical protein